MKIIATKKGESILVDDEDFEFLSKYTWRVSQGYACRGERVNGIYLLHRVVMGLTKRDGKIVDHINRNKLDNQKSNLRLVDYCLNCQNRNQRFNSTTAYKGVTKDSTRKKPYRTTIGHYGKYIHIGYFATAEEAYEAYCEKAIEIRGFV